MTEVNDVNDLLPIIKKTMKNIFRERISKIKILKASKYLSENQNVLYWDVKISFETGVYLKHDYLYKLYIKVEDGKVVHVKETY